MIWDYNALEIKLGHILAFPCIPSHSAFHSFVKVSGKRRARLAEADFNFIAACGDYQNDIAWLIMNTYLFSTCVQINVQNTQRFLNSELKYVFPSFFIIVEVVFWVNLFMSGCCGPTPTKLVALVSFSQAICGKSEASPFVKEKQMLSLDSNFYPHTYIATTLCPSPSIFDLISIVGV